jgi:hypothetical protein
MIDGQLHNYINSLNWIEGVTKHEQTHRAFLRAANLGCLSLGRMQGCGGKSIGIRKVLGHPRHPSTVPSSLPARYRQKLPQSVRRVCSTRGRIVRQVEEKRILPRQVKGNDSRLRRCDFAKMVFGAFAETATPSELIVRNAATAFHPPTAETLTGFKFRKPD